MYFKITGYIRALFWWITVLKRINFVALVFLPTVGNEGVDWHWQNQLWQINESELNVRQKKVIKFFRTAVEIYGDSFPPPLCHFVMDGSMSVAEAAKTQFDTLTDFQQHFPMKKNQWIQFFTRNFITKMMLKYYFQNYVQKWFRSQVLNRGSVERA